MSETILRQFDPRLKLILLPLLIVATFSAGTVARLLLLTGVAVWFSHSQGELLRLWWRVIRPIRMLLLVTLLMHLCFSSGWTLFGQSWLSLDGLQLGLFTCWRIIVALMFAVLLTRTTPVEELAAAFGELLSPVKRLGFRIDALIEFLFLTLSFLPLLKDETAEQLHRSQPAKTTRPLFDRLRDTVARIEPLILDFADRADVMAVNLARGEQLVTIPRLGTLKPIPGGMPMVAAGSLFLILVFIL